MLIDTAADPEPAPDSSLAEPCDVRSDKEKRAMHAIMKLLKQIMFLLPSHIPFTRALHLGPGRAFTRAFGYHRDIHYTADFARFSLDKLHIIWHRILAFGFKLKAAAELAPQPNPRLVQLSSKF